MRLVVVVWGGVTVLGLCIREVVHRHNAVVKLLGTRGIGSDRFSRRIGMYNAMRHRTSYLPTKGCHIYVNGYVCRHHGVPFLIPVSSSRYRFYYGTHRSRRFKSISTFASLPYTVVRPNGNPFAVNENDVLINRIRTPNCMLGDRLLFAALCRHVGGTI